ncbi:hypothetical protein L1987_15404 [Smallanthus sonchifolius]|uniref:Uncharacterized protein n=1 Tax=Smallanthus sonchifolius TaxID=185202 RepID=A0ACB9J7K4_9ASTR|nr:hypothetical protein L1987_15404 [Smallanthus sonchifolius]
MVSVLKYSISILMIFSTLKHRGDARSFDCSFLQAPGDYQRRAEVIPLLVSSGLEFEKSSQDGDKGFGSVSVCVVGRRNSGGDQLKMERRKAVVVVADCVGSDGA